MAAQVEVQPGEVGRAVAGGRLHLNPLIDSSSSNLIEIPAINQAEIIASEPNKPVPAPKPRLSAKPFAVERNATIKPILAPKPQTKPRPESTRLPGHKPELPSNPNPLQPVGFEKPIPVSSNPNRPASTSFKTSNRFSTGQTTKPIAQPFKPAPPFDPGVTNKPSPTVLAEIQKPSMSSYAKNLQAAEWSGTTQREEERGQGAQSKGGTSIARAKSLGFLLDVGLEVEKKAQPEAPVQLRAHSRGSRARPVSAIFPDSPSKTETPAPAPRWAGRRPLSADLTSKFESVGLSLHRKSLKADAQENTTEENSPPLKREQDIVTPQRSNAAGNPLLTDQSIHKAEETTVKETDDDDEDDDNKRGVSIKSRISLLLDTSSTPGPTGQGSDVPSPGQQSPEADSTLGVKKLIKQLTEDTTPTQSPVVKQTPKPRPLPPDLTKRFSSERSPDLVSLSEAADRHEIIKDPQRRAEESVVTPIDQKTFLDSKHSQEQLRKASTPEGPGAGPGAAVQTVRASLFENVVERHIVFMMDDVDSHSSPSSKRRDLEDDGGLFIATYKEPVSPPSPRQVRHAFDTVQAIEKNRAVSEIVPSAQWEDKAMTLRSKRSDGSRSVAEGTHPAQGQSALSMTAEPQPRYLRVGALSKWDNLDQDQNTGLEKGMLEESQREGQERLLEQDSVAAAPKRLKMLPTEEQSKPRATYFALTGQVQEPFFLGEAGTSIGDIDDHSARSALGGLQGKNLPMRRNPSLEEAYGKTYHSQEKVEELMTKSHLSSRDLIELEKQRLKEKKEREAAEKLRQTALEQEMLRTRELEKGKQREVDLRSVLDDQRKGEMLEAQKKRELQKETERHMAKLTELEKVKQRSIEMEKQAHREFAQWKELEMQREAERQRQKVYEKQKRESEEKQRALEMQKQIELEKQRLREAEEKKLKELERETQRQLEREKRREAERMQERERQRERERQKQREEERQRQRELDKERRLLEIQKEKQKMEEMERLKEQEIQQLLEFEKQKQKEKERQEVIELEKQRMREKKEREQAEKMKQMALEQEMLRIRELDKERERQKEMEREHQKEIEREKQRLEQERQQLVELQKQKQREKERHQHMELEKQRLREKREQEEGEKIRQMALEQEMLRIRELDKERERQKEMEREHQKEIEREKQRLEQERQQLVELQKQKQREKERQQHMELEKQRLREKREQEEGEKIRQMALEQEMLRIRELDKERERQKEMEREKQRVLEQQRQRDLERERQRRLDMERQEIENQRLRQREQEKEKRRIEDFEKIKEIERQQLLEFDKRRTREKMEKENAEKMRQIAKQQEAERQRLKEKQRKEEQERWRPESAPMRPKVLHLDSVLRNEPPVKATAQRSDPANRWKEPYKPAILDIDSFTSQAQHSPAKDLFPMSGIQGLESDFGARLQHTPERDASWKVPPQTSGSFSSPVWTTAPQDPWDLRSIEMSVDNPVVDQRKHANKQGIRQDEQSRTPQRTWLDEPLNLAPFSGTGARTANTPFGLTNSSATELNWLPRELQPQESRGAVHNQRSSQGSQGLNRMRSRSVSRRSAPAATSLEGNLSRVRSRSAHREQNRHSWVPQTQGGEEEEEEGKDSGTPVRDTDSQYGTWETGLRTDDSLTPATPSSDSNLSPSPKKPATPLTPGAAASQSEADAPDGVPPSSSSESQPLVFPDTPTALLDTSVLRCRAQLGKKRAPRTRLTRAARQTAALAEEETTEDWLYRDSTEAKPGRKEDDSDSEEPARGAEASPAVASQPQRVALFPGMDPSALKAQLKKRGDSDNQGDGAAAVAPSQLSRSPKSPFLPRAARVLPPAGGKENGEEDSPQWLKELKSKKRLSQYESES